LTAVVEKHPPPLTPEDERPKSRIDEVLKSAKEQPPATPATTPELQVGEKKEEKRPTEAEEKEKSVDHSLKPEGGPEGLAEEAGQEGAFNPETGEINWDCPCLGGMAHGPW
jgi:intermembrane space import and assembly protein 40